MADVKKALQQSEKIPRERQRLLLGDGDVDDLQCLMDFPNLGALNMATCLTYLAFSRRNNIGGKSVESMGLMSSYIGCFNFGLYRITCRVCEGSCVEEHLLESSWDG